MKKMNLEFWIFSIENKYTLPWKALSCFTFSMNVKRQKLFWGHLLSIEKINKVLIAFLSKWLLQGHKLYTLLIPFKDYSFLRDIDDIDRQDSLQGFIFILSILVSFLNFPQGFIFILDLGMDSFLDSPLCFLLPLI